MWPLTCPDAYSTIWRAEAENSQRRLQLRGRPAHGAGVRLLLVGLNVVRPQPRLIPSRAVSVKRFVGDCMLQRHGMGRIHALYCSESTLHLSGYDSAC